MNYNNQVVNAGAMEDMNANRGSADDFMFDFPFGKKTIKHFRQIVPVQIHHFYIIDEIRDVDSYVGLLNTLKTSEAHDTVFIYLNTPGGNLYTTLQIMAAIKQSNATVVTCMEGQVASAGTMIFLSGHKHMVSPDTIFMAHNYSGFSHGKGNEIKTRQKFDETYFNKLVQNIYSGFLTPDEIVAIQEDRDVWLDADEVAKRIPHHKLISLQPQEDQTQNLLASLLGGLADGGPLAIATIPTDGGPISIQPLEPAKPAKAKPERKKAKPAAKPVKPAGAKPKKERKTKVASENAN